jgi:hypothetical protein
MSFLESSIKIIWTPQRKALYSLIQLEDSHLGRSAQIYARQYVRYWGVLDMDMNGREKHGWKRQRTQIENTMTVQLSWVRLRGQAALLAPCLDIRF